MLDEAGARSMWRSYETIHAVTYFADESRQAASDAGCRGFWMGYFGFRAAPLGPAGPGTVIATFANFAPALVERSVPDVWTFAEPAALLAARRSSAAAALRRVAPMVGEVAAKVSPLLARVVEAADRTGRPMFAANDDVPESSDPVETLWQRCTSLREHRGDGHVARIAAEGMSGLDAHLLQAGAGLVAGEELRAARGWTEEQWVLSQESLVRRGLLLADGSLSAAGAACKRELEAGTDRLAAVPWQVVGEDVALAQEALGAVAGAVRDANVLPFPNPMGLT